MLVQDELNDKRTGDSPLQVNLCSEKISGSYSLLF